MFRAPLSLAQGSESTKAAVVEETKIVIGPLIVVEDISEDTLEFQVDALRHSDTLPDAEVHVPVRQPTENPIAAIPGVNSKNWVTPILRLGSPRSGNN